MAKQILSEDRLMNFPGLTISVAGSDVNGNEHVEEMQLEEEAQRSFESVELEKRLEEIRPDIISYISDMPFLIEVAVTSFSDREKKNKIRDLGLPAIEIDLSNVDYTTTKSELRELINAASTKKVWLSNPRAIDAKKVLQAKLNERIQAINEGIFRNRYTRKAQEKHSYRSSPMVATPVNTIGQSFIVRQYDPRWFVCEACRHLFKIPLREAPYSLETIPCPECDHEVLAKPC
jgi:DNA-directed RNA polymerase subunit RPC12/RpoP